MSLSSDWGPKLVAALRSNAAVVGQEFSVQSVRMRMVRWGVRGDGT